MDRFKKNCVKATEGFNHVLNHLYEQQQYLSELKQRKSLEIKTKGEYAIKQAGIKATEKMSKAADMVHTTKAKAADMVHTTKNKAVEKTAGVVSSTKGRYKHHTAKLSLAAEEK